MLEQVTVAPKRLEAYRTIVGDEVLAELRRLAEPLRDAKVLHVNATAYGGGVAEILASLVPLMRDAGLDASWQVIAGDNEFFDVTKASHNGLQGMDTPLTDGMKDTWRRYNEQNARAFEGAYDFVVVHDPQPAGLLHFHGRGEVAHWIWRCHIDTSQPNPAYWSFYAPYFTAHDAAVFTMREYVAAGADFRRLAIIPPTIDPLTTKNGPIAAEQAAAVLARFGLDLDRPLLTQVSRFDPWKDPLGVIDAYRLVKRTVPQVQLALVGSMATDDPEGWTYLDKTSRRAGEDDDVVILHNFHGVGPFEVGCFQTASSVVVQKSTREGFGLVVAEALWRGKPVVGGNVGGIPLQVRDGETGFLVDSVESCAERMLELLRDPSRSAAMGAAGREHVRRNYLTTRHLRDYLRLFRTLAGIDP